jgi:hypothetical protein
VSELPEGARLVLIAGLELCGAVLSDDPIEELRLRAERMRVLVGEHIEIADA